MSSEGQSNNEKQGKERINKATNPSLINFIHAIINPYNPYETDSEGKVVYAYVMDDAMDREELERSELLLQLRLETETSIKHLYKKEIESDKTKTVFSIPLSTLEKEEVYFPYSYTFKVTGDYDSTKRKQCSELREASRNYKGWIKGRIVNANFLDKVGKNAIKIPGCVSLQCGLYQTHYVAMNLPLETEAYFVFDFTLEDKAFSDFVKEEAEYNENITSQLSQAEYSGSSKNNTIPDNEKTSDSTDKSDIPPESIDNAEPESESDGERFIPGKYKVSLYNVGCGNTITIEKAIDDEGNTKSILFDCGYGNGISSKDLVRSRIAKLEPDVIVISHWHADHFLFLQDVLNEINKPDYCPKMIIYPSHVNLMKSQSNNHWLINTLLHYHKKGAQLINLSKVNPKDIKNFLINRDFEDIYVFLGKNQSNSKPTPSSPLDRVTVDNYKYDGYIEYDRTPDDSGVILSIECFDKPSDPQKTHYAILPGDCSYYSWPDEPELKLKSAVHLVVPHHGGNVICTNTEARVIDTDTVWVSSGHSTFVDLLGNIGTNTLTFSHHRSFVDDAMNISASKLKITYNNRGTSEYFYI